MHTKKCTKSIKELYILEHKEKRKKEQRRSHGKECTLIDWPNSLKTVPSGVANCRNLPFGGRATRDSRDACSMKGIRAESPPTFI